MSGSPQSSPCSALLSRSPAGTRSSAGGLGADGARARARAATRGRRGRARRQRRRRTTWSRRASPPSGATRGARPRRRRRRRGALLRPQRAMPGTRHTARRRASSHPRVTRIVGRAGLRSSSSFRQNDGRPAASLAVAAAPHGDAHPLREPLGARLGRCAREPARGRGRRLARRVPPHDGLLFRAQHRQPRALGRARAPASAPRAR